MANAELKNMTTAQRWELWLKALTLVGAIIAGWWTYQTYTETKEREFYTTYWNRKLELFLNTSQHASTLATTTDPEAFRTARANYLELFYGRLSLVEGESVKQAMMAFIPLIPAGDPPSLPLKELEQPSYQLTLKLKQELVDSWKNPFSELSQ